VTSCRDWRFEMDYFKGRCSVPLSRACSNSNAPPRPLRIGVFRDPGAVPLSRDGRSARHLGGAPFWLAFQALDRPDEWVDLDVLCTTDESAVTGDIRAVRKMQAVQALVDCMRGDGPTR